MSARWQEILAGIGELEKQSPYNFCDRWCERCATETKLRCKTHHIEVGMQMTAIARGKEEEELSAADFDLEEEPGPEEEEEDFPDGEGEEEIDPEAFGGPEFEEIRKHIEFVRASPLLRIAKTYRERARAFLDAVFAGGKKPYAPEILNDLDTVAWYHTLLMVKIERGLAGFHEPAVEEGLALYDAVGQFEICKKAVRESLKAFRSLQVHLSAQRALVPGLTALLHHIQDNIRILEDNL